MKPIFFIQLCMLVIVFFGVIVFPWFATFLIWIKEKRFVVFLPGAKIQAQSDMEMRFVAWNKTFNAISMVCVALLAVTMIVDFFVKGK